MQLGRCTVNEEAARLMLTSVDPAAAKAVVSVVATELDGLARQVWAFGLADGPRRAVAIVSQMAAELALGAARLYESQQWYAGAALVRQLIESEYLLFLFATEPSEPKRWLSASSQEARRLYSPVAMRERSGGQFRVGEYSIHCEIAGHPRPAGHFLLQEHRELVPTEHRELLLPDNQWVDLAQHLERVWAHYLAAVTTHSPTNVYPDRFERVNAAIAKWHSADPFVPRI